MSAMCLELPYRKNALPLFYGPIQGLGKSVLHFYWSMKQNGISTSQLLKSNWILRQNKPSS